MVPNVMTAHHYIVHCRSRLRICFSDVSWSQFVTNRGARQIVSVFARSRA